MKAKPLSILETRIKILRMYFEEQKPVAQIANEMKVTRTRVFSEINTAGKSMQVQLDAQIANIVRDSVSALAAMAEEIKVDAEQRGESMERDVLKKRQLTVDMYATMYDRVLPLVQEYWKRQIPEAMPIFPEPIRVEQQLINGKEDEDELEELRESTAERYSYSADED